VTRRIRIAHVAPWPAVGGTERATARLARALDSAQFQSLVVYDRRAPAVGAFFEAAGLETVAADMVEPSFHRPGPFLRACRTLAAELRRRESDLLHCQDLLAAHRAACAGWFAGVPVLCHIRGRWPDISLHDKSFLLPVRRFVFVAHAAWRDFGFRVSARRGCVIYDGIEVPEPASSPAGSRDCLRRQWGIPADAAVVGMISRIAPPKDHRTFLRAASRVIAAHPAVRFLVIGDHPHLAQSSSYFSDLLELVRALGLDRHVVFTGFQADVKPWIDLCDLTVLSTHSEGLPLVILEAMAQAKPVIATAVGGNPEAVADGQTGFLVPPGDDNELAGRILRLLANPSEACAMGLAAREVCRERFSVSGMAGSMAALYTRMLR
jgi:glycosyltransferase involved in cell wall biosynthesis